MSERKRDEDEKERGEHVTRRHHSTATPRLQTRGCAQGDRKRGLLQLRVGYSEEGSLPRKNYTNSKF